MPRNKSVRQLVGETRSGPGLRDRSEPDDRRRSAPEEIVHLTRRRRPESDWVKAFYRQDPGQNKEDEHYALRDREGRLRAFRREDVQGREVQKGLHDQDEEVKVKRDDGADDVDPAPGAGEMKGVARRDRCGEDDQREDAKDDGRRDPAEGKEETGDGGRNRRDEKHERPAIHAICFEQSPKDDEPGENSNQTERHMNQGKSVHGNTLSRPWS